MQRKHQFVISSVIGNVKIIDVILSSLGNKVSIDQEKAEELRLLLGESISNAIIHGNKELPEKRVLIEYEIKKSKVIFCISDEGSGFDMDNVNDPTHQDHIEQQGGRGIYFIKRLSKNCHYCNHKKALSFSLSF